MSHLASLSIEIPQDRTHYALYHNGVDWRLYGPVKAGKDFPETLKACVGGLATSMLEAKMRAESWITTERGKKFAS